MLVIANMRGIYKICIAVMTNFLSVHFGDALAETLYNQKRRQFLTPTKLQLALSTNDLEQASTIAQNNLASLVLGHKADFLKAICLSIAHAPHFSGELVARPDWRSKASLEFLQIGGIAAAKFTQETVCSGVPAEETVDDDAAKAHLLTGFGGRMQWIVVTIQT